MLKFTNFHANSVSNYLIRIAALRLRNIEESCAQRTTLHWCMCIKADKSCKNVREEKEPLSSLSVGSVSDFSQVK